MWKLTRAFQWGIWCGKDGEHQKGHHVLCHGRSVREEHHGRSLQGQYTFSRLSRAPTRRLPFFTQDPPIGDHQHHLPVFFPMLPTGWPDPPPPPPPFLVLPLYPYHLSPCQPVLWSHTHGTLLILSHDPFSSSSPHEQNFSWFLFLAWVIHKSVSHSTNRSSKS